MVNLILKRGMGKTTRLMATSELFSAPIICLNETQRRHIIDKAKRWNYRIPTPITTHELSSGQLYGAHTYSRFLIDESQDVLASLVSELTGAGQDCVLGMTTTDLRPE